MSHIALGEFFLYTGLLCPALFRTGKGKLNPDIPDAQLSCRIRFYGMDAFGMLFHGHPAFAGNVHRAGRVTHHSIHMLSAAGDCP